SIEPSVRLAFSRRLHELSNILPTLPQNLSDVLKRLADVVPAIGIRSLILADLRKGCDSLASISGSKCGDFAENLLCGNAIIWRRNGVRGDGFKNPRVDIEKLDL